MGMGWTVEDLSKPQIMIESTFGDSHPGSAGLLELVNQAAEGVHEAGGKAARYFTTDEMLPAAGQGILAVQVRAGESFPWLSGFLDPDGTDCALAERAFVRRLNGGCSSPVAAYATVKGEELTLKGMDVTAEGGPVFGTITGPRVQAEALGTALADRIREERT